MDYPKVKKKYALIASEREKICEEHKMRFVGRVPCSGPLQCMLCGSEKRGYVSQPFKWKNEFGRTNKCPTCGLMKVQPDPTVEGPVTEFFPTWACPGLWCGYENGDA